VRVAIVAAKYPYDNREAYLDRELRALAPHLSGIAVFPTSPRGRTSGYRDVPADVQRLGLFSPATIAGALTALVTRPAPSLRAIGALLLARERPLVKLKNLAVIPLGLAVGMRLRRGGFEHVHSYWLSTPATVAYLAAAVAGIPWSSTAHLWDIYEENALALKLRSAQFVRAISARGRRDLLAAAPGVPPSRVHVLHVGVDISPVAPPFTLRQAQGDIGVGAQGDIGVGAQGDIGVGAFSVLCAANLVVKKGHADLLHAVARARANGVDVRCTLAGDGELRGELERLIELLALRDAVVLRGHVGHDALLDEIRAGRYDAMALTSLELPGGLMEGIPVALMEAMALGLPVITTATGSITELVDERCGRVVAQGDVEAIAAALTELASDQGLRARLARAAYEKVCAEFDVVAIARELARLISDPVSVTSEQAMGSTRSEETRAPEAVDAAWGQG
jgi:glycosyltransferase involved in cell wall biosynthesis